MAWYRSTCQANRIARKSKHSNRPDVPERRSRALPPGTCEGTDNRRSARDHAPSPIVVLRSLGTRPDQLSRSTRRLSHRLDALPPKRHPNRSGPERSTSPRFSHRGDASLWARTMGWPSPPQVEARPGSPRWPSPGQGAPRSASLGQGAAPPRSSAGIPSRPSRTRTRTPARSRNSRTCSHPS